MISFPPLLLFLPFRPSPLACISCTGVGIGAAAWVQFLQWLTSAQRLSKSNPLRLTQQPRTCVPLPGCVSHSCCCQPQHFALESYADAGLRWPTGQMFLGTPRGASLVCLCNHTSEVGLPTPLLVFRVAFFSLSTGISGTRTYPYSCCE